MLARIPDERALPNSRFMILGYPQAPQKWSFPQRDKID
jgi:hypothetical protein